jgi:TolB-like protein
MSLFAELKRRNVLRVAAAYVVAAWLVIQVVETVFPAFGFGDTALRVVIIVLAIGLVPVVVLTWAFELTPDGLKLDKDVDRSQSIAAQTGKQIDRIILVALVIALGYFAFDKFVLDPARDIEIAEAAAEEARATALVESYGDKSIAVLPFVNMSSDPEQAYFSDGIAEELLNLLARIPALRVISRSSSFSFRGDDINIPQVAETLNVRHVLEGSVRRSGNRVRITAQLIDARSDTHLWSDTYDRPLDDIFAIQDEVAGQVVEQLRLTLLGEAPRAKVANVDAYMLVLEAGQIVSLLRGDEFEKAAVLLHQALAIEPDYVDALVTLNLVYWVTRQRDWPAREEELTERLQAVRARVLALDPDNVEIKASIAWDKRNLENDITGAARLYEEALATEPSNLAALRGAGWLAVIIGKTELAIRILEYVAERDPLTIWNHDNLGKVYRDAGRYEDALRAFTMADRLKPQAAGRRELGLTRLLTGDPAAALEDFEQLEGDNYQLIGRAMAFYSLGREEESTEALQQLRQRLEKDNIPWPHAFARIYAWIGKPDEAFRYLRITAEHYPNWLTRASFNPFLNKLHDDPRWLPFLQEIGRTPEQLEEIKFSPRLPWELRRGE